MAGVGVGGRFDYQGVAEGNFRGVGIVLCPAFGGGFITMHLSKLTELVHTHPQSEFNYM